MLSRVFRLCVVSLVASVLWACPQADGRGKKNPMFLVIGHRGAPRVAAENTIPSLEAAIEQGANAVEIDLCVTMDRAIVLWHDRDPDDAIAVARQSGVEGLLYDPFVPPDGSPHHRPVDQLLFADFVATHGYARDGVRDPAATIAVLEDLALWAAAEPALRAVYVDVKLASGQSELADFLFEAVAAAWAAQPGLRGVRPIFLSPHRDIVMTMIAARDRLRVVHEIAWDFERPGALEGAEELELTHVSTGLTPTRTETDYFDEIEELVEARQKGRIRAVTAWTIDRPLQMSVLLYLGVDGIMTNDPGALFTIWQDSLK